MPPDLDAKPPPAPAAPSRHPSPATSPVAGAPANSQGATAPVMSGAKLKHPPGLPPVARQARAPTPKQPPSGPRLTVLAQTLVHGGTDFVDKLAELTASPFWKKLSPELQSKVLACVTSHHDMLPLLDEIRDAKESCASDAGFAKWLQGQREPLKQFYARFYQPMLGGPYIDLHPLTSEQRIDNWLETHQTTDDIYHALKGKETELGTLSPRGQQYLIDRAFNLDKQASRNLIPFPRVGALVDLVQRLPRGDHELRGVVAERLINCAITSQRRPRGDGTLDDPRHQARTCALHALDALRGHDGELGQLVSQMLPEEAVRFAEALANGSGLDSAFMSEKRNQILTAVNGLAGTPAAKSPAITALVYVLWDEITPVDLVQRTPQLAHSLAVAVANQWDPKIPPTARLEALLASPAGANLLCTGPSDWRAVVHEAVRLNPHLTAAMLARNEGEPERNPEVAFAVATRLVVGVHSAQARAATPEEIAEAEPVARALRTKSGHKLLVNEHVSKADRREALLIILADGGKTLTRDAFEHTDDAWQLPAIAGPFAEKALATFADGDFPSLSPIGRKNLIGLNLGIAPNTAGINVTAKDIEDTWKALARGEIPPFLASNDLYQGNDVVEKIAAKFVNTHGFAVEHLMLFRDGPTALPLFKGLKLDGTEFYVDQDGHDYETTFPHDEKYQVHPVTAFQNFLDENPLPEGTVYFQGHGFKTSPPIHRETPAARDTSKKIWRHAAQGATALAMIAAIVGTDGLAATVLGYLGVAGAGYLAIDEYRHLDWLASHGDDINPFTNPDQAIIASWLNMVANAAGPFAAAGGAAFRGLAAAGVLSQRTAALATLVLAAGAKGANLAALGDAFVEMARHPERVTASDFLQTAFFAWMALRGSPRQPAAETPPATPTMPPSAPPTARVVPPGRAIPIPPAQPSSPRERGYDPVASGKTPANSNASPGNGYDPAASGNSPANQNVSPDTVQHVIKKTADGYRPPDNPNRPTAMAGKPPPKQPPGKPPQPPRPPAANGMTAGDPKKQEMSGKDGKGGAPGNQGKPDTAKRPRLPTEWSEDPRPARAQRDPVSERAANELAAKQVEDAGQRVRDLQQALSKQPDKFDQLTLELEKATKQLEITVARVELANRITAQEAAGRRYDGASKGPSPRQDPPILKLALQRAEAAVADARLRLRDLERQLAEPTPPEAAPAAENEVPRRPGTISLPLPPEGPPPKPQSSPAGRGGKSGADSPSEVQVARQRVLVLEKALDAVRRPKDSPALWPPGKSQPENTQKVHDLERQLDEARGQFDAALERQLAKISAARKQADEAYKKAQDDRLKANLLAPPRPVVRPPLAADPNPPKPAAKDGRNAGPNGPKEAAKPSAPSSGPPNPAPGESPASPPAAVSPPQGVPQWVLTAEKSPGGLLGKIAELQQEIDGRKQALKRIGDHLGPKENKLLQDQLGKAGQDLAAAKARRSDLNAEAKSLRHRYREIRQAQTELRRRSSDSNLPMAERRAAAKTCDEHQLKLDLLQKQWNALADKIFGPDTPGHTPESNTSGLTEVEVARARLVAAQKALAAMRPDDLNAPWPGDPKEIHKLQEQADEAARQYEKAVADQASAPPAPSPGRRIPIPAAGEDGTSGPSRVKSEVQVAYERIAAAQTALKAAQQQGDTKRIHELEAELADGQKHYADALLRQAPAFLPNSPDLYWPELLAELKDARIAAQKALDNAAPEQRAEATRALERAKKAEDDASRLRYGLPENGKPDASRVKSEVQLAYERVVEAQEVLKVARQEQASNPPASEVPGALERERAAQTALNAALREGKPTKEVLELAAELDAARTRSEPQNLQAQYKVHELEKKLADAQKQYNDALARQAPALLPNSPDLYWPQLLAELKDARIAAQKALDNAAPEQRAEATRALERAKKAEDDASRLRYGLPGPDTPPPVSPPSAEKPPTGPTPPEAPASGPADRTSSASDGIHDPGRTPAAPNEASKPSTQSLGTPKTGETTPPRAAPGPRQPIFAPDPDEEITWTGPFTPAPAGLAEGEIGGFYLEQLKNQVLSVEPDKRLAVLQRLVEKDMPDVMRRHGFNWVAIKVRGQPEVYYGVKAVPGGFRAIGLLNGEFHSGVATLKDLEAQGVKALIR
jgi:hypothetical protein